MEVPHIYIYTTIQLIKNVFTVPATLKVQVAIAIIVLDGAELVLLI